MGRIVIFLKDVGAGDVVGFCKLKSPIEVDSGCNSGNNSSNSNNVDNRCKQVGKLEGELCLSL